MHKLLSLVLHTDVQPATSCWWHHHNCIQRAYIWVDRLSTPAVFRFPNGPSHLSGACPPAMRGISSGNQSTGCIPKPFNKCISAFLLGARVPQAALWLLVGARLRLPRSRRSALSVRRSSTVCATPFDRACICRRPDACCYAVCLQIVFHGIMSSSGLNHRLLAPGSVSETSHWMQTKDIQQGQK